MALSAKSLAGPGYIILNTQRVLNIISLLAVVVACVLMLIKVTIHTRFFFFEGVTHVVTISVSLFLIVSELNLFRTYFARNWPLLAPAHGFVFLGLTMITLGVNLLANLNQPDSSQQNLGSAFWRIVIGAGILVIIFGFFNIVASYVFRDGNLNVTARQVRAKGAVALAEQQQERKYMYDASDSSRIGSESPDKKTAAVFTPRIKTPDHSVKSPIRFPQFGRKSTLPSYSASSVTHSPTSHYSERGSEKGRMMEISGPIGINPQFSHLVRPDSAYHPSRRNS